LTQSRQLNLIERRPRRCRLPPDEVDFLRTQFPNVLDLAPTTERHVWEITPGGVAGVLLTPWRRIVISPKMPICNFLLLLDPHTNELSRPDRTQPVDGREIIDLLASLLVRHINERLAIGLHRGYREQDTQGPFLLGQLDVVAQMAGQISGRRDQFYCRQDDFTIDLPCNQLPRTVAEMLAGSPFVGDTVRAQLRQALAGFTGVSELPGAPIILQDRSLPAGYGPLIQLCALLAEMQAPGQVTGTAPVPALLVSMERLFEQYLTRTVQEAFAHSSPEVVVEAQEALGVGPPPITGQPSFTIRPDVLVRRRRGQVSLIIDAKWKRLPTDSLITPDIYQVLTYGALTGAQMVMLVYPGRRAWEYTFDHTPLRLHVRALDVAGPLDRCHRARKRFMRRVREALS
jgi:5-methylcytosine-specific restriction endonuclease McrBC regulatory subunit McrC